MKKKLKTLLVVAVAAVAGYNVYASHVKSEYSDVVLANVEALAQSEIGSNEYICIGTGNVVCPGSGKLVAAYYKRRNLE